MLIILVITQARLKDSDCIITFRTKIYINLKKIQIQIYQKNCFYNLKSVLDLKYFMYLLTFFYCWMLFEILIITINLFNHDWNKIIFDNCDL